MVPPTTLIVKARNQTLSELKACNAASEFYAGVRLTREKDMEHRNLEASKEALLAIKGIVGDALATVECRRPPVPKLVRMTRLELAYGLKRLQHAELCHYLRCDAPREVLLMIRHAVEQAHQLLEAGEPQITSELAIAEPYRHKLYAAVTTTALIATEREGGQTGAGVLEGEEPDEDRSHPHRLPRGVDGRGTAPSRQSHLRPASLA